LLSEKRYSPSLSEKRELAEKNHEQGLGTDLGNREYFSAFNDLIYVEAITSWGQAEEPGNGKTGSSERKARTRRRGKSSKDWKRPDKI